MELLERMESNCSVCHLKLQQTNSAFWCFECQKRLCHLCNENHAKSEVDHSTLPYDDYEKLPPFIKSLNLFCQDHGKKLTEFCRDHDQILCKECQKNTHGECQEIPHLEDIISKVKHSMAFEDIIANLEVSCKTFKNVEDDYEANMKSLQDQREIMIRSVQQKADEIIDQVQKMKDEMISSIDQVISTKRTDLSNKLTVIHLKRKDLQHLLDQVQDIQNQASNFQTFVGIKEMERKVHTANRVLNDLIESGELNQIDAYLEFEDTVQDRLKEINLFGDVKIIKSPLHVFIDEYKRTEGQIEIQKDPPVDLYFLEKHHIEDGWYYGSCALPNRQTVFTDYRNHVVHKYDENWCLASTLAFPKEKSVYDVTLLDNEHIAVSQPKSKTISVIQLKKFCVTKTISTRCKVGGLTFQNGEILFCAHEIGITQVNTESEEITTIRHDTSVGYKSHIDAGEERICYTSPSTHSITVLDSKYQVIFIVRDQSLLVYPMGISMDKNMNIFVTGCGSHNLVIISPEAIMHQVLSRTDDLRFPTSVSYNEISKELLITNEKHGVRTYFVGLATSSTLVDNEWDIF